MIIIIMTLQQLVIPEGLDKLYSLREAVCTDLYISTMPHAVNIPTRPHLRKHTSSIMELHRLINGTVNVCVLCICSSTYSFPVSRGLGCSVVVFR